MSKNGEVVQRHSDGFGPRMRADRRAEHVRARTGASDAVRRGLCVLIAAWCLGCSDASPTSPGRAIDASEIDRLLIFVRDWPNDYVEIDLRRQAGQSTLVMFRPAQPGVPRLVLDSIGPSSEDPQEIVELLNTFDVWAMADSNAAGAACSTKSGQWNCNITFNDYSLVMQVIADGEVRAQRYTHLERRTSSHPPRALADFIFAWMRRVKGGAGTQRGL